MGKSTISMVIFNSYFDKTRGYMAFHRIINRSFSYSHPQKGVRILGCSMELPNPTKNQTTISAKTRLCINNLRHFDGMPFWLEQIPNIFSRQIPRSSLYAWHFKHISYTGWWFGTWILWLSIQSGMSIHPNWRTHSIIFQRCRLTTNQYIFCWYNML